MQGVLPVIAGASTALAVGAPFVAAGALKSVYDLGLQALFRRVPIDES